MGADLMTRWWSLPKKEAHTQVVDICDWFESDQKSRESRMLRMTCLYEGKKIPGLHPAAYYKAAAYHTELYDELYWNIPRSLCQTVQAKIAGRQRPKPQFVTSGADWATKRRSKKLDRFVEAQLSHPQGIYEDAWQIGTRVFLDAAIWGMGVVKVFSDLEEGQVALERVFPWQLYVDPLEAAQGQPLNLFHVYSFDKDKLIAKFPKLREKIENAKSDEDDSEYRTGQRVARQVRVYEAWRLPLSKTLPGRHVICIDGATLVDEEYARREFPFVFLRWSWELMGFGSTSLIEEVETICDEVNHTLARMQESERLTSKAVCLVKRSSSAADQVRGNDDAIVIEVDNMDDVTWTNPPPFSQETLRWLDMQREQAYKMSGVSEMSATSRKESGVTAAIAMRTIADMESERFAVIYRQYEQMYVALARHIVACTRELADEDKDFAVKWPGSGFLQEIKWGDVDLPEDQYVIQIHPVSGVKNTPADRLQLAQELNAGGKLSDDSFFRVIQYLDTESEFGSKNRQRELVGKYIEQWLDATPEKLESGEFRYRAPIPFLNHEDALMQGAEAYLDAELEEAPDFNLEFFLRWMTECDQQIQAKAQQQAALAAQAQGAPQPGAMPPAPPPPMN